MTVTWLYAVQFAAPLILICWLVLVPSRSGLGFVVQVFSSFAALAVMALQGIWPLQPWWAPFVFSVALGVAALMGLRCVRPYSSAMLVTWGAWTVMVLFIVLGTASTYGTGDRIAKPHQYGGRHRESGPPAGAGSLSRPQWRKQQQHQRALRNA